MTFIFLISLTYAGASGGIPSGSVMVQGIGEINLSYFNEDNIQVPFEELYGEDKEVWIFDIEGESYPYISCFHMPLDTRVSVDTVGKEAYKMWNKCTSPYNCEWAIRSNVRTSPEVLETWWKKGSHHFIRHYFNRYSFFLVIKPKDANETDIGKCVGPADRMENGKLFFYVANRKHYDCGEIQIYRITVVPDVNITRLNGNNYWGNISFSYAVEVFPNRVEVKGKSYVSFFHLLIGMCLIVITVIFIYIYIRKHRFLSR